MKTIEELREELEKINDKKIKISYEIEELEDKELYSRFSSIKWLSNKKWDLGFCDNINLSTIITDKERGDIFTDGDDTFFNGSLFSLDYDSVNNELCILFNDEETYISDFLIFIDKHKIKYINKIEGETIDTLNAKIQLYTKLVKLLYEGKQ